MGNTPLLEYGIVHAGIYWYLLVDKGSPKSIIHAGITG